MLDLDPNILKALNDKSYALLKLNKPEESIK